MQLDFACRRSYLSIVVFERTRRLAWLLILVLVTGLTTPVLSTAAPQGATPAAITHQHADGSVHSHIVRVLHDGVRAGADGSSGKIPHCPECLTHAACAVSCLGLAVLPVTAVWVAVTSAAVWNPTASQLRPGIAPADDIDPPRTVLHS